MKSKHNDYSAPFLGTEVSVHMDRPMGSVHPKYGFLYPVNYGFVPDTKAPDGEEIDAYVLGVSTPINEFTGICIAIIKRENDDDDKLVVVPKDTFLSKEEIKTLTDFQEQFFKSTIVSLNKPLPYPAESPIGYFERYLTSLSREVRQENELQIAYNKHKEETIKVLSKQFAEITALLNIDFRTLIDYSDFRFSDRQYGAIESLLGLVRAIIALKEFGYSHITLIPRGKDPVPDLKAMYEGQEWCIEVKTVLSKTEWGSEKLESIDAYQLFSTLLSKRIKACVLKKTEQFQFTPESSRKLIFIVINDDVTNALRSHEELKDLIQNVRQEIDSSFTLACLFRSEPLILM